MHQYNQIYLVGRNFALLHNRVDQRDNNGWEGASILLTLQSTFPRLSAIPSRTEGRKDEGVNSPPHQQRTVKKSHPENANTGEHGTSKHQCIPYEPEDEPS